MSLLTDVIKTTKAEIWVDEEDFLRIRPHAGAELDRCDVEECFRVYRELGCGKKKMLQIMEGSDDFTMTREAREYAATHGSEVFLASAMVTNSLAIRLVVNFFNRFYKASVPFESFTSEKEAKIWLKSHLK
jgi:hypothetical protein